MAERRDDRSLGELVNELMGQLGTLVRKEIELARVELTANVTRMARSASLIGVGAAVAYAGFLALTVAAIALLVELGLAAWVAALVVAIALIGVGATFMWQGRAQLAASSLAPQRSVESIKEDVEWVKDHAP